MIAAPSACTPRPSSRSIQSPDSRVSRPMMKRSGCPTPSLAAHRAHERRAEPRHGLVIERIARRPCRERRRYRTAWHRVSTSSSPHTTAGSIATTPKRSAGRPEPADCTGRLRARQGRRRPGRCRARSAASAVCCVRAPARARTWATPAPTVPARDCGSAPARPAICRSTGAGQISTVTCAFCGWASRTDESTTPIVTPSRTRAFASLIDTGSVVASATWRTRDSGPTISTVAGSDGCGRRRSPAPDRLRSPARPAPMRRADFSSSSASVDGMTCATSTPNGARTSSARMWNRREPDRAPAEIEHGDDLARLHAAQERRRSAQPHVHGVGRVADDLERLGNVAELERHAQAALDDVLAGHGQPQQRSRA